MKKTKEIRKIMSFLATAVMILGGAISVNMQVKTNKEVRVLGAVPIVLPMNNNFAAGGVDPDAVYSNFENFQGSAFINGDAENQSGNGITPMIADDLTTVESGPFAITGFNVAVANFNQVDVTARVLVRFYLADGANGAPGTFLGGAIIDDVEIPSLTVIGTGLNSLDNPIMVPEQTVWAGIVFDNDNGTTGASLAQLSNLAGGLFDPPVLGTSEDAFFISDNAGSFTSSNPAGDIFSLNNSVANFGWEILSGVVVTGPADFDFDGDLKTDLSLFRPMADPAMADFFVRKSSDGAVTSTSLGSPGDKSAPADYDGDGTDDLAVYRDGAQSRFFIIRSSDNTIVETAFGLMGDIPLPGDYDGDGNAEVAVYRGSNSTFYYRGTNNNPNSLITFAPYGVTGDKPVPRDYDGDGRLDLAVFRPSNGNWYVRSSNSGTSSIVKFGISSDRLVPADYDGDGRADLAVFRDGVWFILRSSDTTVRIVQFGVASDIPVPGNYDGDGSADIAVFRNGVWYLQQSGAGLSIQQFGQAGDTPLPSSYNQ